MISSEKVEVIIVDDSDLLQFLHKTILEMAGLGENTPAFDNGEEALVYLKQRPDHKIPVLVLLDINMPVMNGWEFLEALPEMEGHENVYVVIVTSSVDESDRKKSFNYSHVFDFLEKPITVESVSKVVEIFNNKTKLVL